MGHKTQASRPVNRGGYWYLLRRVPKEYASLDTRAFVKSTGIRVVHDPRGIEAQIRVAKLDHDLQTYWRRLAAGESAELAQITLHACRHALTSGVPALPFEETRKLSLTEIYQRLHAAVGGTPVAEFLKGQTTPELLGSRSLPGVCPPAASSHSSKAPASRS